MTINVKTFLPGNQEYNGLMELPENATVRDLLAELDLLDHLTMEGYTFVILKNLKEAKVDDVLTDGDAILLLQSMAGG
ncbi:MAG: hypothetical protein GX763_04960 [Clostridiaceae bacterium]|nr:hypothetical protein [Clostridiaceae bacterium]